MFDERLAIDGLRHCVRAEQSVNHLLDRRAFDLCGHTRKVETGGVPSEIAVEIGHEFVERDGKPRRGVEGSHVGHVALNQHDACSGEPRQCVCEDRFHLGIEVVSEVAARNAET